MCHHGPANSAHAHAHTHTHTESIPTHSLAIAYDAASNMYVDTQYVYSHDVFITYVALLQNSLIW